MYCEVLILLTHKLVLRVAAKNATTICVHLNCIIFIHSLIWVHNNIGRKSRDFGTYFRTDWLVGWLFWA